MSAHTPGNWQIETSLDAVRIMSPDGSGTIAHVTLGINGVENTNARLIAEAPAMLELLRTLAETELCWNNSESDRELVGAARSLIAKIEGAA